MCERCGHSGSLHGTRHPLGEWAPFAWPDVSERTIVCCLFGMLQMITLLLLNASSCFLIPVLRQKSCTSSMYSWAFWSVRSYEKCSGGRREGAEEREVGGRAVKAREEGRVERKEWVE